LVLFHPQADLLDVQRYQRKIWNIRNLDAASQRTEDICNQCQGSAVEVVVTPYKLDAKLEPFCGQNRKMTFSSKETNNAKALIQKAKQMMIDDDFDSAEKYLKEVRDAFLISHCKDERIEIEETLQLLQNQQKASQLKKEGNNLLEVAQV
jgi:hypothetical protein